MSSSGGSKNLLAEKASTSAASATQKATETEYKKLGDLYSQLSKLSAKYESQQRQPSQTATRSAALKQELDNEIRAREVEAIISITRDLERDPAEMVADLDLLKLFKYLQKNSVRSTAFEQVERASQVAFVRLLVKFIAHLHRDLAKYLGQYDYASENSPLNAPFYFLKDMLMVVWNWSNRLARFCAVLCEQRGLDVLFGLLADRLFLDQLAAYDRTRPPSLASSLALNMLYRAVVGSLHNLSHYSSRFKAEWSERDFLGVFLAVARASKSSEALADLFLSAYLAIANIFTDQDDVARLDDIRQVTKTITDLCGRCAVQMSRGQHIERVEVGIDDEDETTGRTKLVALVDVDGQREWHLVELFKGLYHLAVNDQIKYEIYETNRMKEYVRLIVYHGNADEKEISLKLLWQLCFDRRIADEVKADAKLCNYVRELGQEETAAKSRSKLVQNAQGVLWLIRKAAGPEEPAAGSSTSDARVRRDEASGPVRSISDSYRHIMISYNRHNRDICLQVKKELERLGFKVWIDIENIRGSSLESMAQAIENSECVLICMTEKYKQSPNCRAEAEYAFQLKKPFVPLIMQASYKPDGWLGLILGSKIFVDFTKYSFDECMLRLRRELSPIFEDHPSTKEEPKRPTVHVEHTNIHETAPTTTVATMMAKQPAAGAAAANVAVGVVVKDPKVLDWSAEQTDAWIDEKAFHVLIRENVRPCNGRQLHQMYTMLKSVPEFFYGSLNVHSKIGLKDISHFTSELLALFE